jgi:hypothetical protein
MGDGARAPRDKCAECFQWREDCGQDQVCRACRLQAELTEAKGYWSDAERERGEARALVNEALAIFRRMKNPLASLGWLKKVTEFGGHGVGWAKDASAEASAELAKEGRDG